MGKLLYTRLSKPVAAPILQFKDAFFPILSLCISQHALLEGQNFYSSKKQQVLLQMFSMTEKCIKTGHFEDKKHKDRGSYKGFCLVFCLSLLKDSVEVREDSRVLLGGIHLFFSRSLPQPFSASKFNRKLFLPNLQVF